MLQVHKLSKEFQTRILFKDVSFSVNPGEKIGFVGRNGAGKSTLFKLLTDELSCDEGEVSISKDYKIGILKQHNVFSHENVLDECMSVLPKDEAYETHKAAKLLTGLGFNPGELENSPESFSGGFQMRINLTKVLLQKPNLLLLDEPTNYLDIISARWLAQFLKKYPGEIILISHDRSFMDAVCTHTMGLFRQSIIKVKGGTKNYYQKRQEDDLIYENTRLNQEKKKKEIEQFVNKFRAKARQASMAQSRQKMLDKMEDFSQLSSDKDLSFSFNFKDLPAKCLVEVKELGFGYEENSKLFERLNFFLNKKDCLAIIGKNGKGKSSLLNCLASELKYEGQIKTHNAVSIGHFGQTNIQRLANENTVEQEISLANNGLSYTEVKSICGAMLFTGDLSEKKVNVLSGGERSRVLLGKILARPTNLLLLDEPSHHLDQESVESLIGELKKFEGTSVIVSHNEHILRSVANRFIIFRHDGLHFFDGTYDEFLEKLGWGDEVQAKVIKTKLTKKEVHLIKERFKEDKKTRYRPLVNQMEKLENKIDQAEKEILEVNDSLSLASTQQDGAVISELSKKLSVLESQVEHDFSDLEGVSMQLDAVKKELIEEYKTYDFIKL